VIASLLIKYKIPLHKELNYNLVQKPSTLENEIKHISTQTSKPSQYNANVHMVSPLSSGPGFRVTSNQICLKSKLRRPINMRRKII